MEESRVLLNEIENELDLLEINGGNGRQYGDHACGGNTGGTGGGCSSGAGCTCH